MAQRVIAARSVWVLNTPSTVGWGTGVYPYAADRSHQAYLFFRCRPRATASMAR